MLSSRLKLVDGNLELLNAAVAGAEALEALLGVSVADDWAGFPEATRVLEKSAFQRIAEINDPDDGLIWQWRRERTAP